MQATPSVNREHQNTTPTNLTGVQRVAQSQFTANKTGTPLRSAKVLVRQPGQATNDAESAEVDALPAGDSGPILSDAMPISEPSAVTLAQAPDDAQSRQITRGKMDVLVSETPNLSTMGTPSTLSEYLGTGLFILSFSAAAASAAKSSATTSASTTSSNSNTSSAIGYLIDSPVKGVSYYINGVLQGTTGADGSFNYQPGDKITFKIGPLVLASDFQVKSDQKVYVQDLAGVDRTNATDPKVVKLAQLIQSLDADNNPDNGISIDTTRLAPGLTDNTPIQATTELTQFLQPGTTLVSAAQALAHVNKNNPSLSSTDSTAPTATLTLTSTSVQTGATSIVTLKFSEPIKSWAGSVDKLVTVNNGALSAFTASSDGLTYTATFTAPNSSATSTISLSNNFTDNAGNQGKAVSASITVNAPVTADTTAPKFVSAATSTDGTKIILTYDEDLGSTTAGTSSYAVKVGANSVTPTGAVVSGKTVELTLATAIKSGETVTLTYTAPTADNATSNAAIQDKAGNDAAGLGSTASPQAVTNNVILAPAVTSLSKQTQNENSTGTLYTATSDTSGVVWSLKGDDASLFSISTNGEVTLNSGAVLDFEGARDKDRNNSYEIEVVATANGASSSKKVSLQVNDVTELPSFITSNTYVAKASASGATDHASAIASLLSNDNEKASWNALAQGVRPVGQAVNLTYAFQNSGSKFQDANGDEKIINSVYSDSAKTFVREVFSHFAQVLGITFTETTSQEYAANGGADLRLFAGTAAGLAVEKSTLGYAFQPTTDAPKTSDRDGNFFFVTDASGLPSADKAFKTAFGDEKNTISHELGHALGLDHPFTKKGFAGFAQTPATDDTVNRFGVKTGGGHDTPATDAMLETIMTYHNAQKLASEMANTTTLTNTPWKLGVYDIAALQHLYGANTATNQADTTYTFDSSTQVFDTIWDGGGVDTIVHNGARDAVLDLRGGANFSRVGFFGGAEITVTKATFDFTDAITKIEIIDATAGSGWASRCILINNNDGSYTIKMAGDADCSIKIKAESGNLAATTPELTNNGGDKVSTDYNLGIAFGVTIENATGGSGNDAFYGNDAGNVLKGNDGNDTFNLPGKGADDIYTGAGSDIVSYGKQALADLIESMTGDKIYDFSAGDTLKLGATDVTLTKDNLTWDAAASKLTLSANTMSASMSIILDPANTTFDTSKIFFL